VRALVPLLLLWASERTSEGRRLVELAVEPRYDVTMIAPGHEVVVEGDRLAG
jgi:hypothetical protein